MFELESPAPAKRRGGYMAKAKRSDTNTPPEILAMARAVFGGPISLDPCSNPKSAVGAEHEVMLTTYEAAEVPLERRHRVTYGSGLTLPWSGSVFVNPPFDHLAKWAQKCAGEHELRGAEVLLLGPARTDTVWFHSLIPSCSAWCLWKGRIRFLGEEDQCPFPLCFVYWGPNVECFERVFGARGLVSIPHH